MFRLLKRLKETLYNPEDMLLSVVSCHMMCIYMFVNKTESVLSYTDSAEATSGFRER
jgi:organic hydroperoxide reductase OsmC/OhrA